MSNKDAVSYNTDHFMCPIGLELMTDPVICSDGITYERSAITKWFETNSTSPKTNAVLANKNLIPNIALKAGITKHLTNLEERAAASAAASGTKRKMEESETEQAEVIRKMPKRKAKKSTASSKTVSTGEAGVTTTETTDTAPEVDPAATPSPAPTAAPTVVEDPMIQVYVRTISNVSISVKVNKSGSVVDIKNAIQSQEGIKPEEMRLIYRGKQLEPHFLLSDYDVTNGTVMHLVLRLKGGAGRI